MVEVEAWRTRERTKHAGEPDYLQAIEVQYQKYKADFSKPLQSEVDKLTSDRSASRSFEGGVFSGGGGSFGGGGATGSWDNPHFAGGGGSFGGGGATGSWDDPRFASGGGSFGGGGATGRWDDPRFVGGGGSFGNVGATGSWGGGATEGVSVPTVAERGPLAGVRINQMAGQERQALVRAELEENYPAASVEDETYLRTADGKRAIDPLSGQGRRIDAVVVHDGQALDSVETTSETANKAAQIAKENRIRRNGGTFVKHRAMREDDRRKSSPHAHCQKEMIMKPYMIDQVYWHTETPNNSETREQIVRRFFIVANYLESQGLTVRNLRCREEDITDIFGIKSDDLTEEGLLLMKAVYDRWLTKIDSGMPPEDMTMFETALTRARTS
ncbi:hypothetical protein P6144_00940 [Sphingomonas sp. HITSZ_GF]|uniref:hypothetical protein n=1 Tax=Sphingomonas sp. HITSZ_GF TaxID=3037247 RepID=UPI00240E92D7|nr:hypothetical protein [Sphingomonas sp. HITSZ_GF]MDG2532201.1 hypothetical protein [Sphingomonas sp. HITSZ_GF]